MRRLVIFGILILCMGCEPVTSDGSSTTAPDSGTPDITGSNTPKSDAGTSAAANPDAGLPDGGPSNTDAGIPENTPPEEPSLLALLEGTFEGELSCYEEGASSRGTATLVLQTGTEQATGSITFTGDSPSEFTTTAQLTLWLDDAAALDGAWSDCQIEGGEYADGNGQLTCHFWHQVQDESGYIFKPNNWTISADGQTFTIEEEPTVESEAQKCDGVLTKQSE
ncbi:MAG: hypothetical protein CMH56_01300 [Myxococcales bacterium]|nr:hypothetical protein [Myxococcales bacterium]